LHSIKALLQSLYCGVGFIRGTAQIDLGVVGIDVIFYVV
jgi:hypothetical protein